MDAAPLENANPTILTNAQLPSRRHRKLAAAIRGPESRFDHILAASQSSSSSGSPWPSDASDDGDEFAEEPIDEQEIYGENAVRPTSTHIFAP